MTYHPIGVMIAIMVYEVRHLGRGLMVVVLSKQRFSAGEIFLRSTTKALLANYVDRCILDVKIPAPINAVPPQRLNHLRTLVLFIASLS